MTSSREDNMLGQIRCSTDEYVFTVVGKKWCSSGLPFLRFTLDPNQLQTNRHFTPSCLYVRCYSRLS
nr:unnamed protein product [Callosobruchus analis]